MHQLKALIINLEGKNSDFLQSAFSSYPIQIEVLTSRERTLETLKKHDSSLTILFSGHPDEQTFEWIYQNRSVFSLEEVPLVVIHKEGINQRFIDTGLEIGVADFISESTPPNLLRKKLLNLLKIRLGNPVDESNFFLQSMIDLSPDPMFVKDLHGHYLSINTAMAQLFGLPSQEIIGKDDLQLFGAETSKSIKNSDELIKKTKKIISEEETYFFQGTQTTFLTTKGPLLDHEGKILKIGGVARNITEERLAQEERDRFFELSMDMMCIADLDGYFKRVNPAFEKNLGYTKEELLSRPFMAFVHPDDHQSTTKATEHLYHGNPISHFENRYIAKDGSIRWLDWSTLPQPGSRLIAIARDITDQKNYQIELETSESRFRKLFEESPFAIQVFSPNGDLLRNNRASRDLCPLPKTSSYNILNDAILLEKGCLSYIKRAFSGQASNIPPFDYDPAEFGSSGRIRKVQSYVYPILDRNEIVREVILLQWDISEQVRSETTLKLLAETGKLLETSLDYQATLEKISDLAIQYVGEWCEILILDENDKLQQKTIAHSNPRIVELIKEFREKYSIRPDTPYGPAKVIRTGQTEYYQKLSDEILKRNAQDQYQLDLMRRLNFKSYIGAPLRVFGRVCGVISIASIRRNFNEHDLALAQELASRASLALGNAWLYQESQQAIHLRDEFLAVASHELRTPLTSLSLQIQSFQRVLKGFTRGKYPTEKMIKMVDSSERQVHGLSRLIDELFDLSRIREGSLSLHLEQFDLLQTIEDIVADLSDQIDLSHSQVSIQALGSFLVFWDKFRIGQVITNLLTNAIKYGSGKPIHIKIEHDSDSIRITFIDEGIGIEKKDQERIFKRFERAVPGTHFRGLGLGLYITREIIQLHQGTISLQSEIGKGSTFIIRIPLSISLNPGLSKNLNEPNSADRIALD